MLIDKTPPYPDESLNGYLLRLADANGYVGANALLAPLGLRLRTSYSDDQLREIAVGLSMPFILFSENNPKHSHPTPTLNARFMPGRRQAVCPECIRQDGYIRTSWSNSLIPACTKHRLRLVDLCCNCEAPLGTDRPSLSHCHCGQALEDLQHDPATPLEMAIAAILLGVKIPELALLPANLWEQRPEQLDVFLWFMYCHAGEVHGRKPMKRPYPTSTAQALTIINGAIRDLFLAWPRGFHNFLHNKDISTNDDSSGVARRWGAWYRRFHKEFNSPAFQWLHDEFARHVTSTIAVSLNDRTTNIPASLRSIQSWISLTEAAKVLGIKASRLRAAIDTGAAEGIVRTAGEQRDLAFIKASEIERIRLSRANYVNGKELRLHLGISSLQLTRLIDAGAFKRYDKNQLPVWADAPFIREEVENFLSKLKQRLIRAEVPPQRVRRLSDFVVTRSMPQEDVTKIFTAIVNGDIKPRDCEEHRAGLDALIFDEEDIRQRCITTSHDSLTLTMTQVCDITGWKPDVVAEWIRAGLLPASHVPNGAHRAALIRVADLLRFQSQNLVLADVAAASGSQSRYLKEGLQAIGCDSLSFKNSSGVSFGLLIPLGDLGRALSATRPNTDKSLSYLVRQQNSTISCN